MNEYIKARLEMLEQGDTNGELDEKYSGGLWDWAGEIASLSLDEVLAEELQEQIYYAFVEMFNTLNNRELEAIDE
jgi:hypothetical protein